MRLSRRRGSTEAKEEDDGLAATKAECQLDSATATKATFDVSYVASSSGKYALSLEFFNSKLRLLPGYQPRYTSLMPITATCLLSLCGAAAVDEHQSFVAVPQQHVVEVQPGQLFPGETTVEGLPDAATGATAVALSPCEFTIIGA